MSSWVIAEQLLREGVAYHGRGNVTYGQLVKLFQYLQNEPGKTIKTWDPRGKKEPPEPRIKYSGGTSPAKGGGFADVNFPFTAIWEPFFADADKAIRMATSADTQHLQRQIFSPAVGAFGKKTWTHGTKDIKRDPQLGPSPDDLRTGGNPNVPYHARPSDTYDVIIQADLRNVDTSGGGPIYLRGLPHGKDAPKEARPSFVALRVAWTPAVGDPNRRSAELRSLLAGNQLAAGPTRRSADEPGRTPDAPIRPEPIAQAGNPLAGATPRQGMFQNRSTGSPENYPTAPGRKHSRALPPKLGTPERDEWEMSRPPEKRSALWKRSKGIG